ncbi:MAG: IclR family transcriptional regulator [Rhodobacteraceae bacterium]|jgi:DNA-binding IclR family transcriptional regulator|nr:IclR family transcriptional regulator [Paracoccaceae bacterium]
MSILNSAASVLRCFGADCTELTVTDTVEKLGIPKSNASRLLRAMREAGLLETIGDTKRHRPGVLVLDAAISYRRSSGLVQRAADVVARISADTGHTGYVSKLIGTEVAAVTDHPGTHALRVVSNIGRRLEAHSSGTGRALLALMSDAQIRALYPEGLVPASDLSPQSIEELLTRVAEVRRLGVSYSRQESTRGVDAQSVAASDPETGEAVALCIVYPAALVADDERLTIERMLLNGAADVAAALGHTTPTKRRV